ncbi:fungal-specific transcription factor domain-containing protein [Xylariales sp. PMI_506]|nr:fungal-specific transcription factor domain-containing protein [Xylariales sp. PMI_506]
MLLYTRVAPPKVPKRRSRAANLVSKLKKKKCDEHRPQCSRCVEKSLECTYEVVKPRQRKTRDSDYEFARSSPSPHSPGTECETTQSWEVRKDSCASLRDDVEDTASFTTTDVLLSPSTASTFDFEFVEAGSDSKDWGITRRGSDLSVVTNPLCLPPDLALISPCPLGSPTLDFYIPAFSEFSDLPNRRALVGHFCNVLSHLIVFREESGNPFQQLVLPLSHNSSPIMNAIYALASAHLEYRGVSTGEKSVYFHNEAIQGLAQLIQTGGKSSNRNELLAAIMLLVYYEVLVQRGRSNIVDGHLRGALTIMESTQSDSSPTGIFLERAFRFYDVITALSLGTAPVGTAPAAGCLIPLPPLDATPSSPLCNVDTLLGMATTLWPIMHRLSNLASLKNELELSVQLRQNVKIAVLRSEFETTAQAIEVALGRWKPSLPPNCIFKDDRLEKMEGTSVPELPLLNAILHSAVAYRHSAFVYLYRAIYEHPPGHRLVQDHVHAALLHCSQTVAFKGPMGALLWPLFVAACDAISEEDRTMAEHTFVQIEKHQGMTNIQNAWGVVKKVWKQLDVVGVSQVQRDADLWRRVSKEMGVCLVLG